MPPAGEQMRLALVGRVLAALAVLFGAAPASAGAPAADDPTATVQGSPGQLARKARSEARLTKEGVPFIAWLPVVEDEGDYRSRSTEEIVARAFALTLVAYKATSGDHEGANRAWAEAGARVTFTEAEAEFLRDPSPPEEAVIHFSWQSEAALPLFWFLGYVDELDRPETELDPGPMEALISRRSFDELVSGARPRTAAALLDVLDLTYRYHWAARQAGLDNEPPPAGLDPEILMERHKALNWLVRYNNDASWDDVTTDT